MYCSEVLASQVLFRGVRFTGTVQRYSLQRYCSEVFVSKVLFRCIRFKGTVQMYSFQRYCSEVFVSKVLFRGIRFTVLFRGVRFTGTVQRCSLQRYCSEVFAGKPFHCCLSVVLWPEEGDFPENLHRVVYVIINERSFELSVCLERRSIQRYSLLQQSLLRFAPTARNWFCIQRTQMVRLPIGVLICIASQ